ncbi:MAG: universal stress protein [Deltaproteobacteria bacterium]|nr:universal stress protein [Deltaproteobacteria bacterium]
MEIRKLLYISESESQDLNDLRRLLVLRKLGLEEIVCLSPGRLQSLEGELGEQGIILRETSGRGLGADQIISMAREERASMIAASLRRRSEGGVRSSLGKKLIKSSNLPLVLMPAQMGGVTQTGKEIFSKVLFATSWDPIAQKAFHFLLECKGLIAQLEIVTVVNRKLSIRDMIQLKKLMEDTRGEFLDRGIDAEAHIYAGKPSEEIMLASRDYNADTIVMGATKASGLRRLIYRGCADEVVRKCDLPVFVIP